MFVGQHGSWNRKPPSGYKVIFVPFAGDKPSGPPIDVLTGFLGPDGDAFGRPVGVAIDKQGALLVADDVGNVVWRVTTATKSPTPRRGDAGSYRGGRLANRAINACHDLALGVKHFVIDLKPIEQQIVSHTAVSAGTGSTLIVRQLAPVLKVNFTDGRRVAVRDVLTDALAFWLDFFNKNSL